MSPSVNRSIAWLVSQQLTPLTLTVPVPQRGRVASTTLETMSLNIYKYYYSVGHSYRQIFRQTFRQTDNQTDIQTDRQTDLQTDIFV